MITTVLIPICVTLLILTITYQWMKTYRKNQMLKWIPETPRIPIFGNIFELKNPTDSLKTFTKYLKEYDGLCSVNIMSEKFILVADPKFLEFLLGKMDILNKTDEYDYLHNWLGSGLLLATAPKWKKRRKMLTPSFHFSNLETFIDTFERSSDTLIELLEKEVDKDSFDVSHYCTNCTLDIICEAAMGVSINAQRNPKSAYVEAVHEKCRLLVDRTYSPIKRFDILHSLTRDYYLNRKYDNILHSHTLRVISSRKKQLREKNEENIDSNDKEDIGEKRRKVFLDMLLETTVDGQYLTDHDIREEVDTFMFAGHDTTATALSFSLYCLSLNKDVQDKLITEQKKIFGDDRTRSITNKDLLEMKYLEIVLKECMRLYPPVPYIGRKSDKEVVLKDGNIIPKDTSILVVIFHSNRHPKYFPDPDKFDPSRFEGTTNIPLYTYLPFSAGPRNCIGQKFAWHLLKSVISKVIRNYEILPCGHELQLSAVVVLRSENGIKVKLRKRNWDGL